MGKSSLCEGWKYIFFTLIEVTVLPLQILRYPKELYSHIVMMGETEGYSDQKGMVWVCERCWEFFGLQNNTGIFWGIVVIFPQLKSTIIKYNLLVLWAFFGYAKREEIFLGRQILKLGLFWV